MSRPEVDLGELERMEEAVAKSDEGKPWEMVAVDGGWSIGPDYEMGHRAQLADWCDDEAWFLVTFRNAAPQLIEIVRTAQALFDLDSAAPDQTVGEFRTERMNALSAALQPFTPPTEREDEE